jgi:hypothetical protein
MNDEIKAVLNSLLDKIEDLRAHQVLTTVRLSVANSFQVTDLDGLEAKAFEKNRAIYATLRQTISEL